MIVDFRVVVPRQDHLDQAGAEEVAKLETEGFVKGYSRVYRGDATHKEEWRGSVEGILRSMEEAGVDKAVLQAEHSGVHEDYHALNDAAARIAKEHPDKFPVAFMCLNPLVDEDMVQVLEKGVKEQGFKGICYQAWSVNFSSTDSKFWPVYAKCQELGLIVTIHSSINFSVDRSLYLSHVSHLDKIACDFPELVLVANHGGWPWVNEMVAIAWKHANVYIEIGAVSPKYIGASGSGWETLMRYGNTLLQDRVLFATDCMLPHKRCVDELKDLPLKEEVKEKWLGGNAARLLGL